MKKRTHTKQKLYEQNNIMIHNPCRSISNHKHIHTDIYSFAHSQPTRWIDVMIIIIIRRAKPLTSTYRWYVLLYSNFERRFICCSVSYIFSFCHSVFRLAVPMNTRSHTHTGARFIRREKKLHIFYFLANDMIVAPLLLLPLLLSLLLLLRLLLLIVM